MQDKQVNIQQNSAAQGQTTDDRIAPDALSMNDSKANVENDNLMQGVAGTELNPEFGDAADPADEELGQHHRDE